MAAPSTGGYPNWYPPGSWPAPPWLSSRSLRIGHRERQLVAEELARHCGEGRLTVDELDERIARAWRAQTQVELDELTADLPPRICRPPMPIAAASSRIRGSWVLSAFLGAGAFLLLMYFLLVAALLQGL